MHVPHAPDGEHSAIQQLAKLHDLGDIPIAVLLERVRQLAYATLRGHVVTNAATGFLIRINRRGIDHTLRHTPDTPAGRRHAESVLLLDVLLQAAKLVRRDSNRDPAQRRSLIAVHRLEAEYQTEAGTFTAHLLVKEAPDGMFFYDHRLFDSP